MQFIRPDINLDFVGKRKITLLLSLVLIVVGMAFLLVRGPNYGIDFAGGTLIQIQFTEATTAAEIKDALEPLALANIVVQQFGDAPREFLLRAQEASLGLQGMSQKVQAALETAYGEGKVEIRRSEMVGPQAGKDLRQKGLLAVIYAMIGILIYVTWRFEFRFAVGSIIAILHDVLITLGAFALTNREIDLPIIAAFLAIIGYSLNDTIIIYDRIRENLGKMSQHSFSAIVNRSINETLSRTILTSGTTLLVVFALFIFGGGVIHNFAFALLVGIVVGTYSSIFIASPVLLFWETHKSKKETVPTKGVTS
ncbi:MAG: protein translocase subunit SecF [Desulfuromonadales bacterium]